jgi:hypothetical protein
MARTTTKVAEIVREYGPYPGVEKVAGVTYDGEHVWFAIRTTSVRMRAASRERRRC